VLYLIVEEASWLLSVNSVVRTARLHEIDLYSRCGVTCRFVVQNGCTLGVVVWLVCGQLYCCRCETGSYLYYTYSRSDVSTFVCYARTVLL
jgi:hypothetical protein